MRKLSFFILISFIFIGFMSAATITVTSPHAGDIWYKGRAYNIIWTTTGIPASTNMKINIFKGSIAQLNFVKQLLSTNDGTESWPISHSSYATGTYYIRIKTEDSTVDGDSGAFVIRNPPAATRITVPKPIKPGVIKPRIEKKKLLPKPKVALILISGFVTIPDSRKLPGVKIRLHEIKNGGIMWIKDRETNRAGWFQLQLGEYYFNKKVKLVPKHPQFREGQHFSPQEDRFQITRTKMSRNFRYTGPLPDIVGTRLKVVQPSAEMPLFGPSGPPKFIEVTIKNQSDLDAGPFKVKIRFDERFPLSVLSGEEERVYHNKEITIDFPTLRKRSSMTRDSREIFNTHGIITLKLMQIDIDDSVIESNEENNIYTP